MNELDLSQPVQVSKNKPESCLNNLKFRIKNFKKGDFIAYQNDEIREQYFLLKGSAKAEVISGAGTVLQTETLNAPALLAPAFLFAEENQFPVDVTALKDCEIMLITKQSVMQLIEENEEFKQAFTSHNIKTKHVAERLQFVALKTIKGKLALYILQNTNGLTFKMDKSHRVLAEYFGVDRLLLSRNLSDMQTKNIIALDKNKGQILNLQVLQDLVV